MCPHQQVLDELRTPTKALRRAIPALVSAKATA